MLFKVKYLQSLNERLLHWQNPFRNWNVKQTFIFFKNLFSPKYLFFNTIPITIDITGTKRVNYHKFSLGLQTGQFVAGSYPSEKFSETIENNFIFLSKWDEKKNPFSASSSAINQSLPPMGWRGRNRCHRLCDNYSNYLLLIGGKVISHAEEWLSSYPLPSFSNISKRD